MYVRIPAGMRMLAVHVLGFYRHNYRIDLALWPPHVNLGP